MIRYLMAAAALLFPAVRFAAAAPQRVVFEGAESEHKWALKDLNPNLPADWTGYDFLVLEMRASSPQRFNLTFYQRRRRSGRQMQPLANVWIRAAVPLQYYRQPNRAGFDLASVGKVPRNSFWISTGGVYGPLNAVEAIGVTMQTPLGKPTLEIRSVRLAKEDPGSDILDRKPVVDEFGQWIPADWPGKVKSLDQLKKEWAAEEAGLRRGRFRLLQVRRLSEHQGQGDGLLPCGAGGRAVVVRGSGRAPVLFDEFDRHGQRRRRRAVEGPGRLFHGAAAGGSRRRRPDAVRRRASTRGIWRGGTARNGRPSGSIWRSGGWSHGV